MFLCLQQSYHALIIDMRQLSSDGDICASVSHDALVAPTFPIAVGNPPTPPIPTPLSRSLSVSLSLSPLDSLVTKVCRRGSHHDEIEVGSCSFSPRVII